MTPLISGFQRLIEGNTNVPSLDVLPKREFAIRDLQEKLKAMKGMYIFRVASLVWFGTYLVATTN